MSIWETFRSGCAARCAERLCLSGKLLNLGGHASTGGAAAHIQFRPKRKGRALPLIERHSRKK